MKNNLKLLILFFTLVSFSVMVIGMALAVSQNNSWWLIVTGLGVLLLFTTLDLNQMWRGRH